jgi:glycosyltransferase involved in cell wall biosynthesis
MRVRPVALNPILPANDATRNIPERILFIAEVEAWGGAERSFLALCDWLHRHSLPYRLVVYWDRIGLEQFASHPLNKTELNPANNPRSKILALRKYFASVDSAKDSFQPLVSGYQPALHATLAGLRGFHCMMHDTESLFGDWDLKKSWKRRLRLALNRRILHKGLGSGGKTIVASEFLKRDTEQLYKVDATIARIGSSVEGISFRPRPIGAQLNMLSVSRVEINKRIDWILLALAEMECSPVPLSRKIDWHLDIVGQGAQLQEMQAMSRQLGLDSRVSFRGFVSDQQLSTLYDQADLFLMPARQGYGIPALEALHRGIPVLLHRESGISDILLDTPWAQVFEGGRENLKPAMEKMIHSVVAGFHLTAMPPHLPTQDEWAEEMARLCGWI